MQQRVAYFSKYSDKGPSSRYRIFQLLPFFNAAGINVQIHPLFDDRYFYNIRTRKAYDTKKWLYTAQRFRQRIRELKDTAADLIVIEHQLFPYIPFLLESRFLPPKFLLEFDDAIYLTHPRKIPQLVRRAMGVLVGNQTLAAYASAFQNDVHVIPTVLNTDVFKRRNNAGDSTRVTIGWSGLSYNFPYLYSLAAVLKDVSRQCNVEILILADSPPKDAGFPYCFIPWDGDQEVEQISAFDIGLMPLRDDAWSRGKCGMKLLQYMSLEVAAIASPVGVNLHIVNSGQNAFLASSDEEWRECLLQLITDESLRRRMGAAGRKTVEEQYSVRQWFPKIEEYYRRYMT